MWRSQDHILHYPRAILIRFIYFGLLFRSVISVLCTVRSFSNFRMKQVYGFYGFLVVMLFESPIICWQVCFQKQQKTSKSQENCIRVYVWYDFSSDCCTPDRFVLVEIITFINYNSFLKRLDSIAFKLHPNSCGRFLQSSKRSYKVLVFESQTLQISCWFKQKCSSRYYRVETDSKTFSSTWFILFLSHILFSFTQTQSLFTINLGQIIKQIWFCFHSGKHNYLTLIQNHNSVSVLNAVPLS